MSKSYQILIAVAAVAATINLTTAHAGGLFGEGGLIRGDIGKLLDPIREQGVDSGGPVRNCRGSSSSRCVCWRGTWRCDRRAGRPLHQPGLCWPNLRSQLPWDCRPQPNGPVWNGQAALPNPIMMGLPVSAPLSMPQISGNFCFTPVGMFGPGPINPVGMPCHAIAGGQLIWGTVGRF